MRKGYVQVYTGSGKGKTTAALGLALRSVGAGHKVLIAQFIKKRRCSEHLALERFGEIVTVRQYGAGFVRSHPPAVKDVEAARKGLFEVRQAIASCCYHLVILDEVLLAVHLSLLDSDALLGLIEQKPPGVELVLTGRGAPQAILDRADLVTEMQEIRHYHQKGVRARRGIEC